MRLDVQVVKKQFIKKLPRSREMINRIKTHKIMVNIPFCHSHPLKKPAAGLPLRLNES